ncbi:MAG TPA: class I SAM-dependent methyltransferase [Streptosporangiaceae bacterium]|nr:class I SAM-dependent methyltransferase [Streptosporangiaceae bacterium]
MPSAGIGQPRSGGIGVPSAVMDLLACPRCSGALTFWPDACICECGGYYPVEGGLISFASKDFSDKYDSVAMATRYVQYAFGAQLSRSDRGIPPDGRSEGLYRTISDICRGELLASGTPAPMVVDMGCGVGRTVYDIASVHAGATVIGFDLSATLARCARDICAGHSVRCGASEDGWPQTEFRKRPLGNVFIAQANACSPPLKRPVIASVAQQGPPTDVAKPDTRSTRYPNLVLVSMLLDRLRAPEEVRAAVDSATGVLAEGGLLVASCPFNWTTERTWRYFGLSRTWLADALEKRNLAVEIYFDYLPYRECLDPFGTTLELPVQVCAARKKPGV